MERYLGQGPEVVRHFLDSKGFPRTAIPTITREFSKEDAVLIRDQILGLLAKLGKGGAFRTRTYMVLEELAEMFDATALGDLVAFADAWGDLMYVVISLGVTQGLPCEDIFRCICEANQQKDIGAVKPAGWTKPDMTALLTGGLPCQRPIQTIPSSPEYTTPNGCIGESPRLPDFGISTRP
jgi:hypothetical protein